MKNTNQNQSQIKRAHSVKNRVSYHYELHPDGRMFYSIYHGNCHSHNVTDKEITDPDLKDLALARFFSNR